MLINFYSIKNRTISNLRILCVLCKCIYMCKYLWLYIYFVYVYTHIER